MKSIFYSSISITIFRLTPENPFAIMWSSETKSLWTNSASSLSRPVTKCGQVRTENELVLASWAHKNSKNGVTVWYHINS